MPLIILTGIPSSGKTQRTNELKEFFKKEHGLDVKIVDEIEIAVKAGFDRNSLYEGKYYFKSIMTWKKKVIKNQLDCIH